MGIKTVVEFEEITRDNCLTRAPGQASCFDSDKSFDGLKKFLLNEKTSNTYQALIEHGIRNGKEYIKVKNYIGVISLKTGDSLEILPKIGRDIAGKPKVSIEDVKKSVIKMISSISDISHRILATSNVGTERLPIYEIFVKMFLDELSVLLKSGIKHNYELVEENLNYYKSRVVFSENIKRNFVHMERCFSEHDEFTANNPENRLIKSTLELLIKTSKNNQNINLIKNALTQFDGVPSSHNYSNDFSQCIYGRDAVKYQTVLSWCKIFLQQRSFTSFAGDNVASVLLFPMEKVFEVFIAKEMRKVAITHGFSFKKQDHGYFLYSDSPTLGELEPDIVITDNNNRNIYIMDTKWKVLENGSVAKGDDAQMYTYQHKYTAFNKGKGYTCRNVTLIYPFVNDNIKDHVYSDKIDNSCLIVSSIDVVEQNNTVEEQLKSILNRAIANS